MRLGNLSQRLLWVIALGGLLVVFLLSVLVGFVAAEEGVSSRAQVQTPRGQTLTVEEHAPGASFNWDVASIFGTALGTTLLAVMTGLLALSTWQDVRASQQTANTIAQQLELQSQQARTDYTPLYPLAPFDWATKGESTELVVKNGGRGIALNVGGWVSWEKEKGEYPWTQSAILATTIAAGETQHLRVDPPVEKWIDSFGAIDFDDMTGLQWRCEFAFGEDGLGLPFAAVRSIQERWRTGDPPEAGPVPTEYTGPPPLPGVGIDQIGVDAEDARAQSRAMRMLTEDQMEDIPET